MNFTRFQIPYILSAMKLTDNQLKLFASPWSSPGWMKTNGRMKGGGKLKGAFNGKYYKTYAQYFVRCVALQLTFGFTASDPGSSKNTTSEECHSGASLSRTSLQPD